MNVRCLCYRISYRARALRCTPFVCGRARAQTHDLSTLMPALPGAATPTPAISAYRFSGLAARPCGRAPPPPRGDTRFDAHTCILDAISSVHGMDAHAGRCATSRGPPQACVHCPKSQLPTLRRAHPPSDSPESTPQRHRLYPLLLRVRISSTRPHRARPHRARPRRTSTVRSLAHSAHYPSKRIRGPCSDCQWLSLSLSLPLFFSLSLLLAHSPSATSLASPPTLHQSSTLLPLACIHRSVPQPPPPCLLPSRL